MKHLSDDTLKKYLAIALGEPPATAPAGKRRVK
jgi:hypothetical protein